MRVKTVDSENVHIGSFLAAPGPPLHPLCFQRVLISPNPAGCQQYGCLEHRTKTRLGLAIELLASVVVCRSAVDAEPITHASYVPIAMDRTAEPSPRAFDHGVKGRAIEPASIDATHVACTQL